MMTAFQRIILVVAVVFMIAIVLVECKYECFSDPYCKNFTMIASSASACCAKGKSYLKVTEGGPFSVCKSC
uniref:Uncharacterized protein n=1 Tax=Amphimedon queenslandica TaxID=400682 RepID=A0A1X7SNJ8_AMPQE